MLFIVANNTCRGDPETENAARKILQDFRVGRMGPVALQLAPDTEDGDGQTRIANVRSDGLDSRIASPTDWKRALVEEEERLREEIESRSRAAVEAVRAKGLDSPPVMESIDATAQLNGQVVKRPAENDAGKGLFD